jgi:hypothetical protein
MEIELNKFTINSLPIELIQQISLDLTYDEIRKFCRTSKRFEKIVCNNDIFWRDKLAQDFPNLPKEIYERENLKKQYLLQLINLIGEDINDLLDNFIARKESIKVDLRRAIKAKKFESSGRPSKKAIADYEAQLREQRIEINRLKDQLEDLEIQQIEEIRKLREKMKFYQIIQAEL